MNYSGILRICISVACMEKSLSFYRDNIGYHVVAEGTLDAETVRHLYGLADSTARYAMLKNNEQETLLQLIAFSNNTRKYIRDGRPAWDYGYLDIAVRAKDNYQSCLELTEQGYTYMSTPVHYVADWINMDVSEGVLIGPDKLPIAMIQRLKEPIPEFEGRFSMLTDCAQIMRDMEEAKRFYGDVLGFQKVFDAAMPDGLVDPVVQVPYGTHTHMVMYLVPGCPVVELVHYSIEGKSMADAAKPENIGLFATAFQTDDLEGTLADCKAAGFAQLRDTWVCELQPYGTIKSAWVKGPSDTIVEFFEIL